MLNNIQTNNDRLKLINEIYRKKAMTNKKFYKNNISNALKVWDIGIVYKTQWFKDYCKNNPHHVVGMIDYLKDNGQGGELVNELKKLVK